MVFNIQEFEQPGQQSYDNISVLLNIARNNNIVSFLEIGTSSGMSLMALVEYLTYEKNKPLKFVVVSDTWGGVHGGTNYGSHDFVLELLEPYTENGLDAVFLDGESQIEIPKFAGSTDKTYDLIHVDGLHTYDGCRADVKNCRSLLKDDGLMVVDDTHHHAHMELVQCMKDICAEDGFSCIYKTDHGTGATVLQKS